MYCITKNVEKKTILCQFKHIFYLNKPFFKVHKILQYFLQFKVYIANKVGVWLNSCIKFKTCVKIIQCV